MTNLFDLSGKSAIVTGASRGLGKSIAIGLAQAGTDVLASDILDCTDTVTEIKKLGKKAVGIKTDVTNKTEVQNMVQTAVKEFGKIDIFVNNAGIVRSSPAETMEEKDWDAVINVNLKGEWLCAQEAGKQMIKQKSGSIINIASIAGLGGSATSAAYCASKAGVILMTKTLALEWGKHGIRVNTICPGVFVTAMTEPFLKDPGFAQLVATRVALERSGSPKELAGMAVYLASDAASYTTGAEFIVDGGWRAGM